MDMYELRLVLILALFCITDGVYASHFRGAVIMVRPKAGEGAKEVSYRLPCMKHVSYMLFIVSIVIKVIATAYVYTVGYSLGYKYSY